MNLNDASNFINAVQNPERTCVDFVKNGGILDSEDRIKNAEAVIRTIKELWIPGLKEAFESAYHSTPQYPETEAGKATLARIETYKSWMKLLKNAIGQGKTEIERQQKQKDEKEAISYTRMFQDNRDKSKGDPELIEQIAKLANVLKGKNLLESMEPTMKSRRFCGIAHRNLERLKAEGVKDIPTLQPLVVDGLESDILKLTSKRFKKNGWE